MSTTPAFSTQVIGQTENALGALMNRVLARTGGTFRQWVALNGDDAVTAVSRAGIASNARKDASELLAAVLRVFRCHYCFSAMPGSMQKMSQWCPSRSRKLRP